MKLLKWMFIVPMLSCAVSGYAQNREPIIPIPDVVITSEDKVTLGERLFHDARFSSDQSVSCGSCHSLIMGGADGKVISVGVFGRKGTLNTPTVFNSSLNFRQFWDGRAANLSEQMSGPIRGQHEMDFSWPQIKKIIEQDTSYMKAFTESYSDGVTVANIKNAIVLFEKTLLTPNSRFDKYLKGDEGSLSNNEKLGYLRFKEYGCTSCHQGVGIGGNLYQKLGIFYEYTYTQNGGNNSNLGRYKVTGNEDDRYMFKVPSLRNVALTAPYFHDGSEATLEGTVEKMMFYQLGSPSPAADVLLIVDFLRTLTGEYQGKPL